MDQTKGTSRKNQGKTPLLTIVSSGLDLDISTFLPDFLKVIQQAFQGKINVIMSRVPMNKQSMFGENINIKYLVVENKDKTGGLGYRIITYIVTQIRVTFTLITQRRADAYFFFLSQSMILPIFVTKMLRRKVILILGASISDLVTFRNDYLMKLPGIEEKCSLYLCDHIVLYSKHLIEMWNLQKYENKISVVHRQFIDFHEFQPFIKVGDRENLIGFMGRFSQEKGILEFMQAIPGVLEVKDNVRFLVGGSGTLEEEVRDYAGDNKLQDKVEFTGWIPHDKLAGYINKLKLLVLPSYTEGLPSIVLEAMACGTPVLATPVGAVPDMIINDENGFLMMENTPESITRNIIRALDFPYLERISENAYTYVTTEFSFDAAVRGYRELMLKFIPWYLEIQK